MNVSDAVQKRKSTRSFTDTPVSNEKIADLLKKAARAPSGGNLQPWRIYVLNGGSLQKFKKEVANSSQKETPAYAIYPNKLSEPYRSSRYKVGEDMYGILGIPKTDKVQRFAQLNQNFSFFGAPCALFCYVDKSMGPPQWSDLGMFLQTFMLLACEAGIATCAQEAWATRPEIVKHLINPEDALTLFCGMAIGYEDKEAKINKLVTERESIDIFTKWVSL